MNDIVSVGEILIDLTQNGIDENGIPIYKANPGGAPANVAVAASKLGAKTAFIGKIGNDYYGRFLKSVLEKYNVDTKGLMTDSDSNTTVAIVSIDENGERSFSFYRNDCADTKLLEDEIQDEQIGNTHFLHFGSVSLTNEPSRAATLSAAICAKSFGATVTYDPNYRANLWNDIDEAIEHITKPLAIVDILKISDEELQLISGTDILDEGTKQIYDAYSIQLILVTLGEKGVYYRFGDKTGIVDGFKVDVADTNGAGDTFFGAFLSRLAKFEKYDLSKLSEDELKQMLKFSNIAAALTVSRSGAIPAMPTLDEVQHFE